MAEEIQGGPGRPTYKRKGTSLRLRIDTDTHELLSRYAKQKGVSMSEIVREAVYGIVKQANIEE